MSARRGIHAELLHGAALDHAFAGGGRTFPWPCDGRSHDGDLQPASRPAGGGAALELGIGTGEAAKVGAGNQIAIDLDGVVRSAPSLQVTEFQGRGVITGNFTQSEAKDLALVLRYGALPVQLDRQTVQTVSASLGRDTLRAGVGAGLVGLGLVAATFAAACAATTSGAPDTTSAPADSTAAPVVAGADVS